MLHNELTVDGENKRLMELIMMESDRLDRIIGDFLEYARMRSPSRQRVSVSECIDDLVVLIRNSSATSAAFEIRAEHDCGDITAVFDEEQMKQVFFNLAINACEAMGGKGTLAILTSLTEDGMVKVSFGDQGPGVGISERSRLFEPFFTTKEGGTGLGLAIANKIVEAHGGRIEVANREEGGAEFSILLPRGMPGGRRDKLETVNTAG